MLRTRPDIEPSHDVTNPADLIPLSILELDLGQPSLGGWDVYLANVGVEVLTDDVGRRAVNRADARMLLTERRESEARAGEVLERNERNAIERDQQWRAQLNRGAPWSEIPAGVSPAERFYFPAGSRARKVYTEMVGKPGLSAIVVVDRETHYFLGVKFLHRQAV